MIPVVIETLIMGSPSTPSCVILRPFGEKKSDGRVLPIWIGVTEATSLAYALEQIKIPRPLTHDLIGNMLNKLDTKVQHINITKSEGTLFYADIALAHQNKLINIDARPSDALAIAVRTKSPIFVENSVMDQASYPYLVGKTKLTDLEQLQQFHEFVKDLTPEDFSSDTDLSSHNSPYGSR